jgi:hypothetical protein
MSKRYVFLFLFILVIGYFPIAEGCGGAEGDNDKPKFYKVGGTVIFDTCGTAMEFMRYNQVSPANNPLTVVITNRGNCTIKLITDQPGGSGRIERMAVSPDVTYYWEIMEKTGIITFDVISRGEMIFYFECESAFLKSDCIGKIEVFENYYTNNPVQWRVTDSLTANVSIAAAHGCGNYDKYIFQYVNTSTQTQRLKFNAVQNNRPFPERRSILPFPPEWYGYLCYMRFWGFAVPPTGTLMDSIFVNGTPSSTSVDITGRRTFYLKASCLKNPEYPDTTGNLCKGDINITLEQ